MFKALATPSRPGSCTKRKQAQDPPIRREVQHLGSQLSQIYRSKSLQKLMPRLQLITLQANYEQKRFEELGTGLQNLREEVKESEAAINYIRKLNVSGSKDKNRRKIVIQKPSQSNTETPGMRKSNTAIIKQPEKEDELTLKAPDGQKDVTIGRSLTMKRESSKVIKFSEAKLEEMEKSAPDFGSLPNPPKRQLKRVSSAINFKGRRAQLDRLKPHHKGHWLNNYMLKRSYELQSRYNPSDAVEIENDEGE